MSELSGLYAIWYREFKVFIRERSRLVASIISPLMWLVVFGTGLGSSITGIEGVSSSVSYQSFIYPGILVMSVLFSAVFYGMYVIWDRKIDFLKEVLVAPLSRTTIFFGKVLGGATDTMTESLILIALGFLFNIHFTLMGVIYTIIIIFILTMSIASIGLIIGSLLSSPEGFSLITSLFIFPIFFLSGALFPVTSLPGWLYVFVRFNPVSYGVDALRGVILGINSFSLMLDLSVITAFAAVLIGLGTIAFRKMKL